MNDEQDYTATMFQTLTAKRVNVTIAPVNGSTVLLIEKRDPRPDGLYEGMAFVVTEDFHLNDCRQDAEELGIDMDEAIRLAHLPDTAE